MSDTLKDADAVKHARREIQKKLDEFHKKQAELETRKKAGEDLVMRAGILRQLKKIAEAIQACRTKIRQAEECIVNTNPADGTGGSHAFENEERMALENAKAELAKLLEEQRREIARMDEFGGMGELSPDDVAALDKAVQDSMTESGRQGTAIWRTEKELEELQRQMKEHGKKADLPKCGAQCKFPEHGLCDNPAVKDGRCWIPDHQAQ